MKHKILFLDHTAKFSGGEVVLMNIVKHLDKSRFEPIVIFASDGDVAKKISELNVPVYIIPISKKVESKRKDDIKIFSFENLFLIYNVIKYSLKIAEFIKKNDIDIIHTNSLKSDIYGSISALITRKPIIWHLHDMLVPEYLKISWLFKILANILPNKIICISQAVRNVINSKKAVVIYNGVDLNPVIGNQLSVISNQLSVIGEIRNSRTEIRKVTMIGRITRWKGQEYFIRSANEVLKVISNVEFFIAGSPLFGEDDYEKEIKDLVVSLNLSDKIKFLGFVDNVPALIRESDIIVHSSITPEPFGQVIIEAMSLGKPVIATNIGATTEIIDDGITGLLVPPKDYKSIANAIIRLINDSNLAKTIGEKGKEKVYKNFDVRVTVKKIEEIYTSL